MLTLAAGVTPAQDKPAAPPEGKKPEQARTVEELAKSARGSIGLGAVGATARHRHVREKRLSVM